MDVKLVIVIGFICMMILLSTQAELPNPELCVNQKFCEYQNIRNSPIQFAIQCRSADYTDVRRMFKCFQSSQEHTISSVALWFSIPTTVEDNFLDGLDTGELILNNVSNVQSLEFDKIKSLNRLILENGNLTDIPLKIHSLKNLTHLWIVKQKLEAIPDFAFQEMRSLETLILRSNPISKIGKYAFDGLEKLKYLELSSTNLSSVVTDSITNLTSLNNLDLSFNQISELKSNAFLNLTSLSTLGLSGNQISSIHKEAFSGLTKLTSLVLTSNKLTSVPVYALKYLSQLESLHLGKNIISEWKSNDFIGLTSLNTLYLDGNSGFIIDHDAFAGLDKLTGLSLAEMRLGYVPTGAIKNLSTLTWIHFGNNRIFELRENDFLGLKSLNTLWLTNNYITKIDDNAFAGLEENLDHLDLRQNDLTKIPVKALQNFTNLNFVWFGASIEHIEADTFKHFGHSIQAIHLENNRIKSFAESAFHHLPVLETLNLENNQLERLKFTVFQPVMNGIVTLQARNNPLVCNCELYWYYVLSKKLNPTLDHTWFSDHQHEHNVTQGECKDKGKIVRLEKECKQEWQPIICNASSLYGCMSGDFCKGVTGCK